MISKLLGAFILARYKSTNQSQLTILPFDPEKQLLPGTFECALNNIVETQINFSSFDLERKNDHTGAPAYNPKVMLKIILFAYSKGIYTSRNIAKACEENTIFMALSNCSTPHFTSISYFISHLGDKAKSLFIDVLLICDRLNLIGGTTFAIDGKKLSSNAAKELSGTKEDFKRKIVKLEKSLDRMITQSNDEGVPEEKFLKKVSKETKKINKIKKWISENEDIVNKKNRPRKSNITDNESCTMKSSSGIIQGYNCQAVVDSKNQIICGGFASGNPQDDGHLKPAIDELKNNIQKLSNTKLECPVILADTAYHNNEALKSVSIMQVFFL
jgi:transposase